MGNTPGLNRRGFLTRGSAATVALASVSAGLTTASAFDEAPATFPEMGVAEQACMRNFCPADFAVGQLFNVGAAGQATILRLTSITTYPGTLDKRPEAARAQPFSLVFVAMNDRLLTSQTHEFHGVDGQAFAAFLSDVGDVNHPAGRHYEVVFG